MQVFVIDVTWNNSDRFEIYRRYSEFFSFQVFFSICALTVLLYVYCLFALQTTLKGLFPVAAGRRNAERTIPQLPSEHNDIHVQFGSTCLSFQTNYVIKSYFMVFQSAFLWGGVMLPK